MSGSPIVLASASPRRRRLIGWLGLDVRTMSTDTDEDLAQPLEPPRLAASLAAEKALGARGGGEVGTVLAFDTIVVLDGQVLGKPADVDEARHMLNALSGRTHQVITGVAVLGPDAEAPVVRPVTTQVRMRTLDAATQDAWLAGDEMLGCAGAYNIERHLASVADDECFQNVAGLPLCHLYRMLASGDAGAPPEGLTPPVDACDAALGRQCRLGPAVCDPNR